MEAWEKKVERIENNPRRRAKESKVREYYEKQFPEIRKQREMQERMQKWVVICILSFGDFCMVIMCGFISSDW